MKPNFTGTWKFSSSKSTLQITAPDSTIMVIDHREPHFRLSRTHIVTGRSDSFSIDLTTDGREVVLEHEGLHLCARAYWDGDTLIFDTTLTREGEEGTNLVKYKLNDTLDSLVAEESLRSKSLNYDNIWVMDRR